MPSIFRLAILAFSLFILSLCLPAVSLPLFDKPIVLQGWQAAYLSIVMIAGLVNTPEMLPVCLAALGNLFFLLAPWLIKRQQKNAKHVIFAWGLISFCLLMALLSPYCFKGERLLVFSGYFVWIGAYSVLCFAYSKMVYQNTMRV